MDDTLYAETMSELLAQPHGKDGVEVTETPVVADGAAKPKPSKQEIAKEKKVAKDNKKRAQ